MANAVGDDPEIGSLTAHLDGEPGQAIVVTQRQREIEIKTNVLGILPNFSGRRNECPYEFLNEFIKLCSIQKRPNEATEEEPLTCSPICTQGRGKHVVTEVATGFHPHMGRLQDGFLRLLFPSNKTNTLKKEILECKKDYDESMSHYCLRFKGLLDVCPNHRMTETEIYYLFYEGANPESKDLMNTSSGGNLTKNKVSEARETLGRLIEAKKAYDQSRAILRRGSANAVKEQEGGVGDRIDRLERALLSAVEKKSPSSSQEKEKLSGPEDGQLQPYYGPLGDLRILGSGGCYGELESEQPEYGVESVEN